VGGDISSLEQIVGRVSLEDSVTEASWMIEAGANGEA
jgi:hypothetical protein